MKSDKDPASPYLIESARLGLRRMTEGDCADIVRWRNNPRIRNHYIYRKPFTMEGELQYYRTQVLTCRVFHFMICVKESCGSGNRSGGAESGIAAAGPAVGCVVMNRPDPLKNQMESGLFLGEESAVGKGYGPEALRLGAEYMFAHWPIDQADIRTAAAALSPGSTDMESVCLPPVLMSRIFTDNLPSIRTHEKVGYHRAGTLRNVQCTDGTAGDMAVMILHSEDLRRR